MIFRCVKTTTGIWMKSLESDDTRNTDTVCPGWEKDDQVTENSADIAIYTVPV